VIIGNPAFLRQQVLNGIKLHFYKSPILKQEKAHLKYQVGPFLFVVPKLYPESPWNL